MKRREATNYNGFEKRRVNGERERRSEDEALHGAARSPLLGGLLTTAPANVVVGA